MTTYTDPESGATINHQRVRRYIETVSLCGADVLGGEIYLNDLRHFVEHTAHIPRHAVVTAREDEIEVNYAIGEDLDAQEGQQ